MSLNTSLLTSDLTSLFASPPSGFDGCANAWGDVLQSYTAGIIPESTTVVAAVSSLQTALSAAFTEGQQDGTGVVLATHLESTFYAFAVSVGLGMAPAYVATPPVAAVGWFTALLEAAPNTHANAATKYANLIDTWMKTGTAVLSSGGPVQSWM